MWRPRSRFATPTTIENNGTLCSRLMATKETEFDGDLWFFTSGGSPKADEVRHDKRVNVSYARGDDQPWVSVSGTGEIVHDRAKVESLWTPILKAWFPKGLDEPDLALLKVNAEQADIGTAARPRWSRSSGSSKRSSPAKAITPATSKRQRRAPDASMPHRSIVSLKRRDACYGT